MIWRVFAIGKPKLRFAAEGIEFYLDRLKRMAQVEVNFLKSSQQATEGALLLERSAGMLRVVLDERGDEPDTMAFYERAMNWELHGVKQVALLIGGADGHAPEVRKAADWVWSLSRLTLQHELALLSLTEQLYRIYALKLNHPYHRGGAGA